MPDRTGTTLLLGGDDAPRVADVLADAFRDYPVMSFVLGGTGPETEEAHRRLVGLFVMARVLRNEPVFGVESDGRLVAAALVSYPDRDAVRPELEQLREQTWARLGPAMRSRYEAYGEAWADPPVPGPRVHLNMIGVRPTHQGRGLARSLLDRVHALARQTPDVPGVTLTTEVPGNVKLYEHAGYRVTRHVRIAPELESWGMFRPNDGKAT